MPCLVQRVRTPASQEVPAELCLLAADTADEKKNSVACRRARVDEFGDQHAIAEGFDEAILADTRGSFWSEEDAAVVGDLEVDLARLGLVGKVHHHAPARAGRDLVRVVAGGLCLRLGARPIGLLP